MRKHIEGYLDSVEFTSAEPLAIASKYVEIFPMNLKTASKMLLWAWDALTNKKISEGTFQEQGIYMWIVAEPDAQEPINIEDSLALIKEIGDLQTKYKQLLSNGGLSKKAMCDLVIPFRDKYRLTDIDALSIARNEKDFSEVAKTLENSFAQEV